MGIPDRPQPVLGEWGGIDDQIVAVLDFGVDAGNRPAIRLPAQLHGAHAAGIVRGQAADGAVGLGSVGRYVVGRT